MQRPTLDQNKLLSLLNWELAAYDECNACHFTSIRRMREPDDVGCNWLDAGVQSDHQLGVDEHFIVSHVVEQTRKQYDVGPH